VYSVRVSACRLRRRGFSNGAIIAAVLLFSGTIRFCRVVLWCPVPPFVVPPKPQRLIESILLLKGLEDQRRRAQDAGQPACRLRQSGGAICHRTAKGDHVPTQEDLELARFWNDMCERTRSFGDPST